MANEKLTHLREIADVALYELSKFTAESDTNALHTSLFLVNMLQHLGCIIQLSIDLEVDGMVATEVRQ